MKIIIVSGGFDPLHSGHIAYFKSAKELGDKLIVALNSDEWLVKKKGKFFMPFLERKAIVENLLCVDLVIDFEDDEVGSASNALIKVKKMYPYDEIIFANGGDRNKENIPEMSVNGIDFQFGVGGDDKKNSSSWILKNWQYYYEERLWGSFYNLFEEDQVKVKELIVAPGKGMSFQRHFKRSEIWMVSKGSCIVNYSKDDPDNKQNIKLNKFDHYLVPLGEWHQITNPFEETCHLIEMQYGKECVEDDIERVEYYQEK
ncbi:adenylyltransferase/cytidyltransferase family protein [Gammaproteobacteria bacterium]|nr:adenylyltransferase/cytidyltransferase family protein [Gammaproteobacteria bacterium]MDC0402153.1 adenylyltransferase/cytidyltransferase family protein [Gammaproteobacteria bacterium]